MQEKLLPLGTVFQLKESKNLIMIMGYYPVSAKTKKPYRYMGVIYPMGISGARSTMVFDDDVIGEILHRGYEDEKINQFNKSLHLIMEKGKKAQEEILQEKNGEEV